MRGATITVMTDFKITDIVRGSNPTNFSSLRGENAYYTVVVDGVKYSYPVNLTDLGGASIFAEMKAITLMRYIRKALADGTFVRSK